MREREIHEQLNRASSLMFLVSMISAWNTVYLDKIVTTLGKLGKPVHPEYLPHISPLGRKHINFLGKYEFDLEPAFTLDNLRPLRKSSI